MAALMKYPSPLFLFMSFALVYPSLCAPEDQVISCLTRHGMNNFTTFPRTKKDDDSTTYYKLLNFSIQNLRFTKPTIAKPLAIILPESLDELVKSVMCCREGLLEIRVRLLRVPQVVTGFIVSRPGTKDHVAELVNAWQGVAPSLAGDFYLSCFVGAGLPGTKTRGISATFKGFYLGPRNEMVSILNQVFPELGIETEDCKEMSWIESILFFSGLSDGSSVSDLKNRYLKDKNYFKAKSDYSRLRILACIVVEDGRKWMNYSKVPDASLLRAWIMNELTGERTETIES
ncbi:hypothetical protein SADUNF_Sadunf19G0071000 [Salix dunnii]|uniref:Uncharacterized protein n=1 Tax=Salix dunnii TaxID=1413687 RepID=A0A835J2G5_9ROSI|nr:hypothetical protein SADUNF_Sadunf19G0071000 [Salix dunnii]